MSPINIFAQWRQVARMAEPSIFWTRSPPNHTYQFSGKINLKGLLKKFLVTFHLRGKFRLTRGYNSPFNTTHFGEDIDAESCNSSKVNTFCDV